METAPRRWRPPVRLKLEWKGATMEPGGSVPSLKSVLGMRVRRAGASLGWLYGPYYPAERAAGTPWVALLSRRK